MPTASVKTYRVYCYDASNRVLTAELVEAASDAEALAIAEARDFGSKCELWEGNRLVAELGDARRQA